MKSSLVVALCGVNLSLQAATPTINSLARDLRRVESVREVKDVTATFAQLAQFGRYADMAALFSANGTLRWGNATATGTKAIESWLTTDAGGMNGVKPGSLDTVVVSNPLVNLAIDGLSAKARFNGWRFQGDGVGKTRIQGGIYENEYAFNRDCDCWKIALLRYYPLYEGDYTDGWRNPGGGRLATPPYHYTTDEAGIPIPPPVGDAPSTKLTAGELSRRISLLNDEDEVRNVQHAYGYYVDRRMWTDVVDLFAVDSTVRIDNVGSFVGTSGARQAMEKWMGPEGLTQGVLNEHLIFDTVVQVNYTGREALARGVEIGLIGDANKTAGWWRFNTFYNRFVKEDGIWKLKDMHVSPLVVANYSAGWVKGSLSPAVATPPEFLAYSSRAAGSIAASNTTNVTDLADLQRRLDRSAAYDGVENVSNAYGFYIDFIDGQGCRNMAAIHARQGHKESPFAGFYQTRERVQAACQRAYGTGTTTLRDSISFHWRPQPVIFVSHDGRSAGLRARLLQPSTSRNSAGTLRGAIYHDQMVLEDGIWRLWSVTIDEFYWTSSSWKAGWAGVRPRARDAANPAPRDLVRQYPPDITLVEMGDPRETGFQGGSGRYVAWPEIQRMWFAYRNPVSGRVPASYWPGCVPCGDKHRPQWRLERNGYQEPPTGPTMVTASVVVQNATTPGTSGAGAGAPPSLRVRIAAGPGEPVAGLVKLEGSGVLGEARVSEETESEVVFLLPAGLASGEHRVMVKFVGSERLKPGETTVVVKV